MRKENKIGIVPPQYSGKEIRSEATIQLNSPSEAKTFFETAKQRLLDVNNWNKIAGAITAQFSVIDEKGNEVTRIVKQNDHLRVNIPGPGSKEGKGYDWVQVEELKEINESFFQSVGFRVRPCSNPFSDKNETAHFYSQDATSSFIVSRDNTQVSSVIIDRNLKLNTDSASLVDKVRDVMIGVTAIGGLSKIQWQGLADGLVAK
ncbi:MAG TPA: hypothetical protein VF144_13650 [Chitinophagaceae bacterium]